jgi:hypothetical protein
LDQPKLCNWVKYRETFAVENYMHLFKDLLQALADRWAPKLQSNKRADQLSDSEGDGDDDSDE